MKNTILTERQEQWGKISGTPQNYIDKKYKQTWLAIVEQFTAGSDLTEDQVAFIERTKKYARGAAVRLKRADFASARLPRKIRG
jgi:hypothetical protein